MVPGYSQHPTAQRGEDFFRRKISFFSFTLKVRSAEYPCNIFLVLESCHNLLQHPVECSQKIFWWGYPRWQTLLAIWLVGVPPSDIREKGCQVSSGGTKLGLEGSGEGWSPRNLWIRGSVSSSLPSSCITTTSGTPWVGLMIRAKGNGGTGRHVRLFVIKSWPNFQKSVRRGFMWFIQTVAKQSRLPPCFLPA